MRHPTKADSLERLKSMGLPIGAVIDVGVLSGTPDLMRAFPDKPHILFEPIAEWNETIEAAYANIPHELVNVAVSDKIGTATLELQSVVPGMKVSHARLSDVIRTGCTSRAVETSTLDALLESRAYEKPYLLKIDVDGAELAILKGATRTLQDCSAVIIEAGVANFAQRIRPLEAAGFDLFDVVDLCYYDDRLAQFDLVYVNAKLVAELKLGMYERPFDFSKWHNYLA